MHLRGVVRTVLTREHLSRTGLITLVVGTWLTLFNQGDVMLGGDLSAWMLFKVFLNYLTPFVVANLGLLSHED